MADAIVAVKTCSKCGAQFSGKKCKPCHKAYAAAWHLANRDRMLALMSSRYAEKRVEDNAKKRAWCAANKELKARRAAEYRAKNKVKISIHDAEYRARVAEELKKKKAAYHLRK